MTLQVFYYRGTNIFCCVLSGTESNFFPQKHSYVTFAGRTDGIGAQMHAAISVLLFAYKMLNRKKFKSEFYLKKIVLKLKIK